MKEYPPCQSPYHVEACSGLGETRDHFTSKAIARQLGWSHQQINAPENIQRLSRACHSEKDRVVPRIVEILVFQKKGGEMRVGDHQRWLNKRKH